MNSNVLSLQQKREREHWGVNFDIRISRVSQIEIQPWIHPYQATYEKCNSIFFFGDLINKHWMEIGEITYYRRYVDDNIIIFDQKKINEDVFTNYMNNLHKYLECKLRGDENNNINYSDLSTHTQKTITYTQEFRENPHKQKLQYISHHTTHQNTN